MSHLIEKGELTLEDVQEAAELLKRLPTEEAEMNFPTVRKCGIGSVDGASLAIDPGMCRFCGF